MYHSFQATATERTALLERSLSGPREISSGRRYGILAGIWGGTFLLLTLICTHCCRTVLPAITLEFQSSSQASWLGTAYLLATCTFTPLYGRLCNVMGRRAAAQMAILFAALGTLACGLSTSMGMLIAARFLGGLGGGGIMTTTKVITSDLYSLRSRGFAQGIAGLFVGLGMGLGVPLGGLIGDRIGWRWAFLLQLPFYGLPLFMTSLNINYTTSGKGKNVTEILKRIDYGGTVLLMSIIFTFLSFLSARYSADHDWSDPSVTNMLISTVLLSGAFAVWELCVAAEPMLAPSLLSQKVPVLVGISNFCVDYSNFAMAYFLPMWFQSVMLTSASEAGLHLLPNSIAMSIGSLFSGYYMHRTGRFKALDIVTGIFPFVASVLVIRLRPDSGPVALWLSVLPLGFGNSVALQTMLIALLAHIPAQAMAVGTGFALLFRGLGQVAGVGVASAIFQGHLAAALSERIKGPDAASVIAGIRRSAVFVESLAPEHQTSAREAYAVALRAVFTVVAASTMLGYIVRLLVRIVLRLYIGSF
ncbi:major facilitator superfamily domain-containing protein [Vararia minispora EC-137]|uniref:Major facilitator superfamily domain-containing protein n=1 Tax=Vararia minispora EC-137 TaxID=1314806 RepID=A0ACB8QBK2_9AGAM|nr:major facilitator superfamily domain-containing protein [Vararia minispora EC-137]